ncbi:MAG: RNA polymerase sigma factor [Deltaproteobacteria bacterium]|nr:RNA polymerase sigma factor [Deltaproteobacteria bacterium]
MTAFAQTLEAPLFWRRSAPTGDALIDALRRGDLAAVGTAYDLHHQAVRAFARRLTGDADAAEDLVQEVFITLAKAGGKFDGRCALRTFLIGIAINHARHHVRAAARRRRAWLHASDGQTDHAPAADASSAQAELAGLLSQALDELPIDQRVAFILCEVEERTAAEAADLTGAPEATMRTRLFHARKKLREALQRKGLS